MMVDSLVDAATFGHRSHAPKSVRASSSSWARPFFKPGSQCWQERTEHDMM